MSVARRAGSGAASACVQYTTRRRWAAAARASRSCLAAAATRQRWAAAARASRSRWAAEATRLLRLALTVMFELLGRCDKPRIAERGGLVPRARVVLHNRVRGSRQLIVAQSADDILDRVVDPGVRDVIAMRHVG